MFQYSVISELKVEIVKRKMSEGGRGNGQGARDEAFTLVEVPAVSKRGFTLVELLVVIAIVGILAAILFPAINQAIKRAEITRAKQEMSHIIAAVKAYYAEYSKMPTPDNNGYPDRSFGDKKMVADAKQQNVVMNILRSVDAAGNVGLTNNPRRIVFLDVPESSLSGTDRLGLVYDQSEGYYLDPWGNPYIICMDTDYDNQTFFSFLQSPPAPAQGIWKRGATVAVCSYGPGPYDRTNSFLIMPEGVEF